MTAQQLGQKLKVCTTGSKLFFRDICVATQGLLSKHKMAPQDGMCQLSGPDQRVFTYVLTLNDSSGQGSRCMASGVVMHCSVTPPLYASSSTIPCKRGNVGFH